MRERCIVEFLCHLGQPSYSLPGVGKDFEGIHLGSSPDISDSFKQLCASCMCVCVCVRGREKGEGEAVWLGGGVRAGEMWEVDALWLCWCVRVVCVCVCVCICIQLL